jgi:hypothetical protein
MDIWTVPDCAMLRDAAVLGAMRASATLRDHGARSEKSK